jgi:hypothetical protein
MMDTVYMTTHFCYWKNVSTSKRVHVSRTATGNHVKLDNVERSLYEILN